jgi:hypothetical protein
MQTLENTRSGLQIHYRCSAKNKNKIWEKLEHESPTPQANALPTEILQKTDYALIRLINYYIQTAECQHLISWPANQVRAHYHTAKLEPNRRVSLFIYIFIRWSLRSQMYSRQTMRWSLRGVNILSAVRGEYRACRWTENFLLVSAKVT